MNPYTEKYLQKLFQAYYNANQKSFPQIVDLPHREFAFLYWTRKGMIRHLAYPNRDVLTKYLVRAPPRHAYHSASYYQKPGANKMDQKEYRGCDLVFDIDSDHIPTSCRNDHNYAICKKCGNQYWGEKPDECPECGHSKFAKIVWICDECLDVSKQQVINLVDHFLLQEFTLNLEDIRLFFSGHRGYHVHVHLEKFKKLGQDARREIADYLTGTGFSFKFWQYGPEQHVWNGFSRTQHGWPEKIAREFLNILISKKETIKEVFGSPRYGKPVRANIIDELIKDKNLNDLITQLQKNDTRWGIAGIGKTSWYRIFEILRDRVKADIDVVVSIDLHRLIRMNGSLHGKTGFRVMELPYEEIASFDPFHSALSFPNSSNKIALEITAPKVPTIRLKDTDYGPYLKGEQHKLPLNVGLFLLCKQVAALKRK